MQAQAVEERFGVRVAPGAWPAVTEPVEAEVAAMLAGLHVERGAKGAIRLRTEPWVPEITASAAGKSVVLKPNVVGELPQAETIELAFRGAKLRVRL